MLCKELQLKPYLSWIKYLAIDQNISKVSKLQLNGVFNQQLFVKYNQLEFQFLHS